ncbi:hypothetical protein PTTG_28899 [Puccinia triticina 1-1 BBBD Race 1]|uniref:Uncharacterized protein n=1 Tax=Puccinia triticina (isolate 1-1 / race 1 (BBBD)) TaxID=630390 RepID=A0A180G830_PUCT1|nr:hypothetical protein PTTG_28899 [Puccinia triticina 1-1 BBBD Race 1]
MLTSTLVRSTRPSRREGHIGVSLAQSDRRRSCSTSGAVHHGLNLKLQVLLACPRGQNAVWFDLPATNLTAEAGQRQGWVRATQADSIDGLVKRDWLVGLTLSQTLVQHGRPVADGLPAAASQQRRVVEPASDPGRITVISDLSGLTARSSWNGSGPSNPNVMPTPPTHCVGMKAWSIQRHGLPSQPVLALASRPTKSMGQTCQQDPVGLTNHQARVQPDYTTGEVLRNDFGW